MGVVQESVTDGIGERRLADVVVVLGGGQLAGDYVESGSPGPGSLFVFFPFALGLLSAKDRTISILTDSEERQIPHNIDELAV